MAKQFNFNYLITTNSVTVSYKGQHYMVTKTSEPLRYEQLKTAIKNVDESAFLDALIPKVKVIKYSTEYFEMDDDGNVYKVTGIESYSFKGQPQHIEARINKEIH